MALAALRAAAVPCPAELSIVLADDALVRTLNRDWRAKDKPTNVLAFPNAAPLLGDVVLAFETCAAEAAAQGKPLADHLSHLVVHGVLHLAGHDHGHAREARIMEDLERRILAAAGIPDPYRARGAARPRRRAA